MCTALAIQMSDSESEEEERRDEVVPTLVLEEVTLMDKPSDQMPKKRRPKMFMDQKLEDKLISWIRETPCLYSKGLREYRDTQKRAKLWETKAQEVDMTGEFYYLMHYFILKTLLKWKSLNRSTHFLILICSLTLSANSGKSVVGPCYAVVNTLAFKL